MMRKRISKTLEAAIARTTFNLSSDGITTSYLDRLIIELLGDDATFAYRLLEHIIGERGVAIVLRRMVHSIIAEPIAESMRPESYYHAMCGELQHVVDAKRISTVHVLYHAIVMGNCSFAYEMRGYGIVESDILEATESIIYSPSVVSPENDGGIVEGENCVILLVNDVVKHRDEAC